MEHRQNKMGLLAVSFGTSVKHTRQQTLEAVEHALKGAFPDRGFYRAWTSGMLRRTLQKAEGVQILSVEEALHEMALDGVTDVLVQPTHLLEGEEYQKTQEMVRSFSDRFDTLAIGKPLLSDEQDVIALAKIVEKSYGDLPSDRLLALMGHGSGCMPFPAYALLERQFQKDGYDRVCIGTVEFSPGIAPVLERIRKEKPKCVHLAPLLLVAGDHVIRDMCGDEPDSWKSRIEREGVKVVCHLKGLGEYQAVRQMYVQHAQNARVLLEVAP